MEALKILVIEDNEADAQKANRVAGKCGYVVCGVAANLTEALRLFDCPKPDICVIDIYLQGRRKGIAFARQMSHNEQ